MIDISTIEFPELDRPEVLLYLFHPRPEPRSSPDEAQDLHQFRRAERDHLIAVEQNVVIGARFHMARKSGCNLLFFHGNGEIVADYDDLAPLYNQMGVNFLAADYRGYGRSTGKPTVTGMMRDCHIIFDYVCGWLSRQNYPGPLVVMGRSLGSASALELASRYQDRVDGLIIESGFAYASPLLRLVGIDPQTIGFQETHGFRNIDKIQQVVKPTVIIHAECDHIIPFSEGQMLYEACRSIDKTLVKIPGANHNDIFMRGLTEYLSAIERVANRLIQG